MERFTISLDDSLARQFDELIAARGYVNRSEAVRDLIRGAIEQGNGRHLLDAVLETMATCGSLEWTQKRAEEEADKAIAALQILPDTPWREALIGLAHIAVQRDH